MPKSITEINEKIKSGKAVVFTAEEIVRMAKEKDIAALAKEVDVVTTATFGPMCSSGAFLNFGHSDPPIRMAKIFLNDVAAYGGLAAVDTYIGAAQPSESVGTEYGGAHVIEDLINGKEVTLQAYSHGTDCYPRKKIETTITLESMNQAYLYNPRNLYQNYAAATNSTDKTMYTYMGVLLPQCANITYSTVGELSPLLKDPELRTIGIGTRVFFGGAQGFVAWQGTQAINGVQELENGDTCYEGYTLALVGDMKEMSSQFIRAAIYEKYGVSIFIGAGIPIPVIDEDMMEKLAVPNDKLYTYIKDYGTGERNRPSLKRVSYAELRSGKIELNGKTVGTAPMSSLYKARQIADILKQQIKNGDFLLTQPVAKLPKTDVFKPLAENGKGD